MVLCGCVASPVEQIVGVELEPATPLWLEGGAVC